MKTQSDSGLDSDDLFDDVEAKHNKVNEVDGNPENVLPSPGYKHARIASLNDSFARPLGRKVKGLDNSFKLDLQ